MDSPPFEDCECPIYIGLNRFSFAISITANDFQDDANIIKVPLIRFSFGIIEFISSIILIFYLFSCRYSSLAKLDDRHSTRSSFFKIVLPIYYYPVGYCLFVMILHGLSSVIISFSFLNPSYSNNVYRMIVFFFLYHIVTVGVAILLVNNNLTHSIMRNSYILSFIVILCFTIGLIVSHILYGHDGYILAQFIVYSVLLGFYLFQTAVPYLNLPHRPAVIGYSYFFVISIGLFLVMSVPFHILTSFIHTATIKLRAASVCLLEVLSSIITFSILFIVLHTCYQDSLFWQGLYVKPAVSNVNLPMQGVWDISSFEINEKDCDDIEGNQNVFCYILDGLQKPSPALLPLRTPAMSATPSHLTTRSTISPSTASSSSLLSIQCPHIIPYSSIQLLLGSNKNAIISTTVFTAGGTSRVYKGIYTCNRKCHRGFHHNRCINDAADADNDNDDHCFCCLHDNIKLEVAVKMLYCMELTSTIIHTFIKEAQLLYSLSHHQHHQAHDTSSANEHCTINNSNNKDKIKNATINNSNSNSKNNNNIVKCYGVCIMPPAICLILEYCHYGSLFDFLHGQQYNNNSNSFSIVGEDETMQRQSYFRRSSVILNSRMTENEKLSTRKYNKMHDNNNNNDAMNDSTANAGDLYRPILAPSSYSSSSEQNCPLYDNNNNNNNNNNSSNSNSNSSNMSISSSTSSFSSFVSFPSSSTSSFVTAVSSSTSSFQSKTSSSSVINIANNRSITESVNNSVNSLDTVVTIDRLLVGKISSSRKSAHSSASYSNSDSNCKPIGVDAVVVDMNLTNQQLPQVPPSLSLSTKLRLARDCIAGVAHLHSLGYVHCDIKSTNFLVTTSTASSSSSPALDGKEELLVVKLADFGEVRRQRNDSEITAVQQGGEYENDTNTVSSLPLPRCINWSAPELLQRLCNTSTSNDDDDDDTKLVTPSIDVWSLACVITEIFSNQIPFDTPEYQAMTIDEFLYTLQSLSQPLARPPLLVNTKSLSSSSSWSFVQSSLQFHPLSVNTSENEQALNSCFDSITTRHENLVNSSDNAAAVINKHSCDNFPDNNNNLEWLSDLLNKAWQYDPLMRCTAQEMLETFDAYICVTSE